MLRKFHQHIVILIKNKLVHNVWCGKKCICTLICFLERPQGECNGNGLPLNSIQITPWLTVLYKLKFESLNILSPIILSIICVYFLVYISFFILKLTFWKIFFTITWLIFGRFSSLPCSEPSFKEGEFTSSATSLIAGQYIKNLSHTQTKGLWPRKKFPHDRLTFYFSRQVLVSPIYSITKMSTWKKASNYL